MAVGKKYWIAVGLLLLVAGWALAAVLAPLIRRGDGGAALQAARDSITVARADAARWRQVAAARDSAYERLSWALDSVLARPPAVVYLRAPARQPASTGQNRAGGPISGADAGVVAGGSDSLPYVPLAAYEELSRACVAAVSACDAAKAARDSVIAAQARGQQARDSAIAALTARIRRETAARRVAQIRDAGIWLGVGALACRLFCPR